MAHRLSARARADLDDIWRHIVTEGGTEAQADAVIDLITDRFLVLSNWPRLGRARNDLRRGLRGFPCWRLRDLLSPFARSGRHSAGTPWTTRSTANFWAIATGEFLSRRGLIVADTPHLAVVVAKLAEECSRRP